MSSALALTRIATLAAALATLAAPTLAAARPVVARAAAQADAPTSDAPASDADPCAREAWLLAGASGAPDDGHAAYLPEWTPVLEVVAACLRTAPLADACLVVRGHTDALAFSPPLARAFGGDEAAQLARGQGRALTVTARLEAMGVAPERLRTASPALGSEVRGVELRLVPGCLPALGHEPLGQGEVEAIVDQRVAAALAALHARAQAAPGGGAPAPRPPRADRPTRWWLDATLDATVLGLEPDVAFVPALSLGAGLAWRDWVGRAGAGLALSTTRVGRVGFEASLLGGRRAARGLEVGAEVRWRSASHALDGPWLEQVLALGARVTACPARLAGRGVEVCLSGAIHPLGWRWRNGELLHGEAVQRPRTVDWAGLVGVGVAVRWPVVR